MLCLGCRAPQVEGLRPRKNLATEIQKIGPGQGLNNCCCITYIKCEESHFVTGHKAPQVDGLKPRRSLATETTNLGPVEGLQNALSCIEIQLKEHFCVLNTGLSK